MGLAPPRRINEKAGQAPPVFLSVVFAVAVIPGVKAVREVHHDAINVQAFADDNRAGLYGAFAFLFRHQRAVFINHRHHHALFVAGFHGLVRLDGGDVVVCFYHQIHFAGDALADAFDFAAVAFAGGVGGGGVDHFAFGAPEVFRQLFARHAEFDDKAAGAAAVHHQFVAAVLRQCGFGVCAPRQDAAEEDVGVPVFLVEGFDFGVHLGERAQLLHAAAEDNAGFVAFAFFGVEFALKTGFVGRHDDVADFGRADDDAARLL